MLVNNHVANINEYLARTFVPGDHLEADEMVIQWYGIGGAFVDDGLPMNLALERKPYNGGKIQNLADVASGIMLRLKIVKSTAKEKAVSAATADNDITADEGGKGTQVLLELTEPWHHIDRLVTGDAYFASVEAALKLKEKDFFHWERKAVQLEVPNGGSWECHPPKARIEIDSRID